MLLSNANAEDTTDAEIAFNLSTSFLDLPPHHRQQWLLDEVQGIKASLQARLSRNPHKSLGFQGTLTEGTFGYQQGDSVHLYLDAGLLPSSSELYLTNPPPVKA